MKLPKINPDELIAVIWDDAQTECKWMDKGELSKFTPAEIKSVGFFHKITKRGLVLKHNLGLDGVADATIIPIGCIKRIRFLKFNEKTKTKNPKK